MSWMKKFERQVNDYLKNRKLKCFYTSVANTNFHEGAQSLMQVNLKFFKLPKTLKLKKNFQLCGLGKLRPNIVLMGYKSNCFVGIPTEERLKDLVPFISNLIIG